MRWNATRHGISSPAPVVPGLEKEEDWQGHKAGILQTLSPVGHLEITLAERVALLSWRLHRVTRYETEAIALSQQKIEGDLHDRNRLLLSFRGESPYASTHPEDVRFEVKHNRQIHNALKRFPAENANKTLKRTGCDVSGLECPYSRQEANRRGHRRGGPRFARGARRRRRCGASGDEGFQMCEVALRR